jgi:hypothetical protein
MGSNEDGKLGIGLSYKDLQSTSAPRLVESIKGVRAIEAGSNHSIALIKSESKADKVYGWGQAEHGAIGMRLVNAIEPAEIKFED